MLIRCRGLMLAVVVVVIVLAPGRAQVAKKERGKEVLELAREVEAGKDITKRAAVLRKGFGNVRAAMNMYNPRARGGIGFGPRSMAIERRLVDLEEDGVSAETLKKESAELARVAHINLVMAEIVIGYAPKKPVLGRGTKEWERDLDLVKTGSSDLLKAVKAADPKAVKAAAARINNGCNNCHDGVK
jgi:hypothetical protein